MVVADMLSILNPAAGPEIDFEKSVFAVEFSAERLQQLKFESKKDKHISSLKRFIIQGWPDKAKELPKELRQYWSFKDMLTTEDDLNHSQWQPSRDS